MRSSKSIMLLGVGIFVAAWLIPLSSMACGYGIKRGYDIWWKDIIGIIFPGDIVVMGEDIESTIAGAGEPWSTSTGSAKVNLKTEKLEFTVTGLVWAGGRYIGTLGPITKVRGTLICFTKDGGSVPPVDTPLVPLDKEGNAHFYGHVVLDPVCSDGDIAFLIRRDDGFWIANGAVRSVRH